MTGKRPAEQIPASKPITKPVVLGKSAWGGDVLRMPPSETTTTKKG